MAGLSRRELFSRILRPPEAPPESVRLPPPEWLPPYLRPPGAGEEKEFVKNCTGCGECVKACPEKALLPLAEAFGDALNTPALLPSMEPCRLCPEQPCVAACEPGALQPTPLERIRMGRLRVAPERCWAALGQPCDYCVTACPLEAAAVQVTEAGARFDEQRCIGCGLCLFYCTGTPRAIEIIPVHVGAQEE